MIKGISSFKLSEDKKLLPIGLVRGNERLRAIEHKQHMTAEIKELISSPMQQRSNSGVVSAFLNATLLSIGGVEASPDLISNMYIQDREYAAISISRSILKQSRKRYFPIMCNTCGDGKYEMMLDLDEGIVNELDDIELSPFSIENGKVVYTICNDDLPDYLEIDERADLTFESICTFLRGSEAEKIEKITNSGEASNRALASIVVRHNGEPVTYNLIRAMPYEVADSVGDKCNERVADLGVQYPTSIVCPGCNETKPVGVNAYHFLLGFKKKTT